MYTWPMTHAILYCRVSTDEQVETGASLDSQEKALMLEALRRGYEFTVVREEGKSGKNIEGRDKLVEALELLDKHKADVLMAVRLDRLSRSVSDVSALMGRSKKKGWGIILSGEKIDTTAVGKLNTHVQAAVSEYERDMIGLRTKEGMAQKKAEGQTFGRVVDTSFLPTYKRVLRMVKAGQSYNSIAKELNAKSIPTAKGKSWYASTVKAIVGSETAKALANI